MHIVFFYHSLVSDWNHGNAHFLRGVLSELAFRGHELTVYEPADGWSRSNLIAAAGPGAVDDFRQAYPGLESEQYDLSTLDLEPALERADLVLVHEWNDSELVRRIGEHRARGGHYRLLFHDTHHRAVTERDAMRSYDLSNYDGTLAFGRVLRDIYRAEQWTSRAWVWHEAADTRVFRPMPPTQPRGDLVWVGNWGDDERTQELREFLLGPVKRLGLTARVYGVRYPEHALRELEDAGIEYGGWLPNYAVPQVFANFRVTVHVPRRPYTQALPGIPTIRPFEALACGIPMVSAPWEDAEHLFRPGADFLVARDGIEMEHHLETLLGDSDFSARVARSGRETLLARHTCAHRVDELLAIYQELRRSDPEPAASARRTNV